MAVLLVICLLGVSSVSAQSDVDALRELNQAYIDSVQHSDVDRFREILADDFHASLGDGSYVDKTRFLEITAQPVTISNLAARDVEIQVMGDFAIVHAQTTYTTANGSAASGRYTDVWARRDGRWLAVAAHVTRN